MFVCRNKGSINFNILNKYLIENLRMLYAIVMCVTALVVALAILERPSLGLSIINNIKKALFQ